MDNVFIMCNDGVGGNLLSAQCAYFIRQKGKTPMILLPSRDEIFRPFKSLIEDQYECLRVPENQIDLLIKYGKKAIGIEEKDEIYLVYPDGLYLNKFAFDYKKYKTNPQAIKSIRILTHKYDPQEKNIYVGLISSTKGYVYNDIRGLLIALSEKLPDCIIHCPVISSWAGITLNTEGFSNLPQNIKIYENDSIINQIEIMRKCEYGIYTDNGFSHISFHLGQNRLLLDPRFGYGRESLMWRARWRQLDEDSIRFESLPHDIADLVSINLRIPQTTLIPKQVVLNHKHEDWSRELLFKF